jgi:hypothetical protein
LRLFSRFLAAGLYVGRLALLDLTLPSEERESDFIHLHAVAMCFAGAVYIRMFVLQSIQHSAIPCRDFQRHPRF